MSRKYFTSSALSTALLLGGLTFTQSGCSQPDKKEISAQSEQAYKDFQTFVSDAEAKANHVVETREADHELETAALRDDFDAKVAAVDRYADQYDDARRQEMEALRTRYTAAFDKREAAWNERAKRKAGANSSTATGTYYKPTNPATQLTAANARTTYESFVQNIKQNEDRYNINDWRIINTEWRALDEAYDQVKGNIPARDLAEIQKEKLKYAAFKSYDKAEARAAQGAATLGAEAQNAKEETTDERSKVGQAIRNTASDAKEVGKDVGQGAAKTGKKVGGAVKDVFDGREPKKD
ncbi:hypothetical protein MTX78_09000 [Hymenobacter tibetensis]|uniref:Lipoprotein n=1 Tax=Hymenobacter tibetensis TaxID=497967 RepID=A0ABY4D351_9BACT|nr:hypothetical protein [Hymenobacter tibetensis]UOG76726.1 hypothetical protein MTX78_09000 [Hymenobacter tibetensis]